MVNFPFLSAREILFTGLSGSSFETKIVSLWAATSWDFTTSGKFTRYQYGFDAENIF